MSSLQKIATVIYNALAGFGRMKYWVAMASVITALLCFAYFLPKHMSLKPFTGPGSDTVSAERRVYKEQQKNPLYIVPQYAGNELTSHPGKMQFRLAEPVIGHFLGLGVGAMLYIQEVLGILFFALIILLVYKSTNDKVAALLTGLGFAFMYVGSSYYVDGVPYFDGFAYLYLAAALYFRNPLLVFLAVFAAAWTDERALMASSLVLVWWQVRKQPQMTFKSLFAFTPQSLAAIAAWVAYFALRYVLIHKYGLVVQANGIFSTEVLKAHKFHVILGLFAGLRWYWLLVGLGFIVMLREKNYLLFLVLAGCAVVLTLSAGIVYDHLRSIAYMFPLLIIFIYLMNNDPRYAPKLRGWLLLMLITSFLMSPLKDVLVRG